MDTHELLRQYAREKLAEAGEATDALDRHRDYFLAFAERRDGLYSDADPPGAAVYGGR